MKWPLYDRYGDVVAYTLVDKDDVPLIREHRWRKTYTGYAITGSYWSGTIIYLHRLLCEGSIVDHVNQNRLDNRRSNLRSCSHAENLHNVSKPGGNNPHRGVSSADGGWRARININKRRVNLGTFASLEDAIEARVHAERHFYGRFAPDRELLRSP